MFFYGLFSDHKSIEFVRAKAPTEVFFNNSEFLFTFKTGGFENLKIGLKLLNQEPKLKPTSWKVPGFGRNTSVSADRPQIKKVRALYFLKL